MSLITLNSKKWIYPEMKPDIEANPDFQKFDNVVRKILTVSREELQKREKAWKRKRAKKKAKP
jgi:hypothetical protein